MLIEPPPESEVDRVSGGVVLCLDNSGRILRTLLSSALCRDLVQLPVAA